MGSRVRRPSPCLLVLALASGCIGNISDLSPGARGGGPADELEVPGAAVIPSAIPMRRLTRLEYRNSLADLFPVEPPDLLQLPADSELGSFQSTARQSLNPVLLTKYLDATAAWSARLVPHLPALFPCGAAA